MSTSETWTSVFASCPCGSGSIVRHVTTQDNPWSGGDVSYSADCPSCSPTWSAGDTGWLTHRGDKTKSDETYKAWKQASVPVEKLAGGLASGYFQGLGLASKKAELAEMAQLGIGSPSYRNYLDSRRRGKTPGEICNPLANREWLSRLLKYLSPA